MEEFTYYQEANLVIFVPQSGKLVITEFETEKEAHNYFLSENK